MENMLNNNKETQQQPYNSMQVRAWPSKRNQPFGDMVDLLFGAFSIILFVDTPWHKRLRSDPIP